MKNKIGNYVSQLMTTVVDTNSTDFVKQLALDELHRLIDKIQEFIINNNTKKTSEKTEKKLLQEDK